MENRGEKSETKSILRDSFSYAKNAKNAPHILAVLSNLKDLIDVSMFVLLAMHECLKID